MHKTVNISKKNEPHHFISISDIIDSEKCIKTFTVRCS